MFKIKYKIPEQIIKEYKFQCEVDCKYLANYSTDYKQNYINYTCWYHKRYLGKRNKYEN